MTRHRPKPPGFTRGPRVADLMTREYESFVESSNAAERAGDAETALEYHRGVPMFTRGAHASILTQLADLRDVMTPWLWARWAAYQCTRVETPRGASAEIVDWALKYVVGMLHGEEMQAAWEAGEDPIRFVSLTAGQDWAFHQFCTFELGGLRVFVEDLATDRLADHTGLVHEWLDARMGGYRLESADPMRLRVRDLATDEALDVLDLGAHVHAGEGGWLIGRLVPSGTAPALMFDTRPLPVDERTARDTASVTATPDGWLRALDLASAAGRFDPATLRSEDRELATDVPGLKLLEAGTKPSALAATMSSLREGRDEVGRAAFRILRSAAEGSLDDDRAAYVGAAALNPHAFAEARRQLYAPAAVWRRWAELVPDPARSRLLSMADTEAAAA